MRFRRRGRGRFRRRGRGRRRMSYARSKKIGNRL